MALRNTQSKIFPLVGLVIMVLAASGPLLPLSVTSLGGAEQWAIAADVAAVGSVVVASAALFFVIRQLRAANNAASAQATIQFQIKFRESFDHRKFLFSQFPIHESVSCSGEISSIRRWTDLDDLSSEDSYHANRVVGAFNDVAQYIADGLSVRSALSQYHVLFASLGSMLVPYIELRNQPNRWGEPSRYGRRVAILYNAAVAYHRTNPIHAGRTLSFVRDDAHIVLMDQDGDGISQFERFPGEGSLLLPETSVQAVIRGTEKLLRPGIQTVPRSGQR